MTIQEWIHKFEVGAGRRLFIGLFTGVVLLGMLVAYDVRVARNFATGEAMDSAQLARNIARGEGYVTRYVRPMSIWMVENAQRSGGQVSTNAARGDVSRIAQASAHPDVANAPAYPFLLAGYMRLSDVLDAAANSAAGRAVIGKIGVELNLKAHSYAIPEKVAFMRFPPDFLIHLLNQALFFLTALMVLWLGSHLFEPAVGWAAAGVLVGSELLWRFSASGLPTMMMMFELTLLVVVLVKLEQGIRTGKSGWPVSILWALAAGLLLGVAMLTRYSLGCLLLPVVFWVGIFSAKRGPVLAILITLVCSAVVAPWLVRNVKVSGLPFGSATYAAMLDTSVSGKRVESSLDPSSEIAKAGFHGYRNKLTSNLIDVFQEEVPKLGGSWLAGMFLAGLLVRFRNPGLGRLRLLAVLMLLTLMVAEAMGRTHLSREWPVMNSENLLVLLSPVVFLFGTSLFFMLLGQFPMSFPQARMVFAGVFVVVMSLPMLFTVLRAKSFPIAYPPYNPPLIQKFAQWLEPDEVVMSDIPEAVAWYANRQAIGFTPNLEKDFFAIHDFYKPINALYLTQETLDGKFQSEFVGADSRMWGLLFLQSLIQRDVPTRFPLRAIPSDFFPAKLAEQALMMDRERWRIGAAP